MNFDLHLCPEIPSPNATSSSSPSGWGPRVGRVSIRRQDGTSLEIKTPGLITSTSRGIVPHLARDTTRATKAIAWVHIPFESFLDRIPPVPTLQQGPHPLHKYLGFLPSQHIISTSLRDPFDGREMPANGHEFVNAYCLRGVRKVTAPEWRSYVQACEPDIVVALSDIPFTPGPHSQKRMTKSIERSSAWLVEILRPIPANEDPPSETKSDSSVSPHLNVFVHMAGGVEPAARNTFARSLLEPLYEKEAEAVKPLKCLDEGVAGYTFDLVPLHRSLSTPSTTVIPSTTSPAKVKKAMAVLTPHTNPSLSLPVTTEKLIPLMQTSLQPLPRNKPRVANSISGPHEILQLIKGVGIDLFDGHWAQRAADWGIALDFVFPPPSANTDEATEGTRAQQGLGHNLYDSRYAYDFTAFADSFRPASSNSTSLSTDDDRLVCPCIACSPSTPTTSIQHSKLDLTSPPPNPNPVSPPFTRAYVHHLLHTHEMSAHALLASHNLSILDAFFASIRTFLSQNVGVPDSVSGAVSVSDRFSREVERFSEVYDSSMTVFEEARRSWAEVEMARGKGRMAREREKQVDDTLGTAVEL
ncbi:uncharacterized protein STEHIDRAFT_56363 [Stereum hirsutum FP-91666 SS1]|uniref:uncharacterized protein n=1 Tax=Stereum hirsutum (strain FP-91666) TaxID=721885 RepID=UPI000440EB8A|nr:uncharacterized protein STEHIDRAFT_56363 [Stereum hirsutum FP-91666 SS1]EIM87554.1 hypothetical protein STEHIDRAFT_56363 [Stereum hirsutum FP-91666 SS1]